MRGLNLLFIVLILSGCGDSAEDAKANQKVEAFKNEIAHKASKEEETMATQEPIVENNTSSDEGFMKKIGFETNGSIITLDTNKTKGYINALGNNLKEKSIELSRDIKEGTLKATKGIGIEMDQNGSLAIDMNKTKDFVNDMGKKMENIAQDVDKFTRSIIKEQNTTH
jgi:hypothetical protein